MTDRLANLIGFRITPVSTFALVFIVVFLLVFATSVAVTYILPESYASTARIKVEPDNVTTGQPFSDPYFVQTTFEIIQSELVLKPVIDKLDLNSAWGKKYFNGETLKTTETMEILKQRLQLAPVKNTELIAITAYSDDKLEAALIANAVAESYCNYHQSSRTESAEKGMKILEQQYLEQEQRIQEAQTDLESLQKKYGIVENVDELQSQLTRSHESLNEKELELSQLQALADQKKSNMIASILPDAQLSDLLGKLNEAEQKYATLTNDYALGNAQVTRVGSLIDVLHKQIDDRVAGLTAGLDSQVTGLKLTTDALVVQIQRSKPTTENESYWSTKRNLDQLTEVHKVLYAKIEDQKLNSRIANNPTPLIIDAAEPARLPAKPNKPLNIAVGAVGGIFLASAAGAAFAFLSFLIGKRLRKTPAAV